jgi:hypothetical protein
MELTDKQFNEAVEIATDLGKKAGVGSADWDEQYLFGGRVTSNAEARRNAEAIVKADDDGESTDGHPNLSGEFADSMTPTLLLKEVLGEMDLDQDEIHEDDLMTLTDSISEAWESASADAYRERLVELAKEYLRP